MLNRKLLRCHICSFRISHLVIATSSALVQHRHVNGVVDFVVIVIFVGVGVHHVQATLHLRGLDFDVSRLRSRASWRKWYMRNLRFFLFLVVLLRHDYIFILQCGVQNSFELLQLLPILNLFEQVLDVEVS